MAASTLLAGVLLLLVLERAIEVAIHKRNSARLRDRGAVWAGPDGFGLILAAQILLFVMVPVEVAIAPYTGQQPWTWLVLFGLVLAQAFRYWCIATLGDRWNVRVVTVPGEARVLGGPYRWVRHPNYLVVMAEVVLLPLAFGAWVTLIVLVPLKGVALWRRIRVENAALGLPPGSAKSNA